MNKPFILTCDASRSGLGYILGQLDENGKERVIEYSGRALHAAEKNYSVSELECLAIVSGIKQFSSYLSTDIPFTIITDHQALKVLNSITTCQNGRIARWALYLQGFKYTVQYRKGELNNADALSRLRSSSESVNNVCSLDTEKGKSNSFCHKTKSDKSMSYNQTKSGNVTCSQETSNAYSSRKFWEVSFEYDQPETVFSLDSDTESSSKQLNDVSKLTNLQKNCPDFKYLYKYLETGKLPDEEKECKKTMYDKEFYEIVDGILIHKYQNRGKKKPTEDKFIIQTALPKSLRLNVLEEFLDHNGYFGVKKTFAAIQTKYYWPRMYQEIVDFVNSCDTCQRAKHSRHQVSTPLNPLPVVNVFERIHLDIVGPLHKTNDGFEYILVCVDSFSRWVEAFPLRTQAASEIARILYDEIFCRYGAPVAIVTDRGQNFLSKLVNAVCEIYNVTRHRTASYNPKANRSCERQNATLIQTLRMYIDKDQSNWNSFLPTVLQALRSAPNVDTSGFSAYKMLFGGEMRLAFDIDLIPRETLGQDAKQHVQQLLDRHKVIRDIARENTETTQQDSKIRYDVKAKHSNFRLREKVLLKVHKHTTGLTPKLENMWKGPYYIKEKVSSDTYRIADSETHRTLKAPVNAKDLKTYEDPKNYRIPTDFQNDIVNDTNDQTVKNDSDSNRISENKIDQTKQQQVSKYRDEINRSPEEDQSTKITDGICYQANHILKQRIRNGEKEYLIEWSDTNSKPTWEADEDVSEELKRLFYVKHTKQGKRRKRSYKFFN